MQHYKDTLNKVYCLDSTEFENLLPPGCVKITQAQADALRLPPAQTPDQLKEPVLAQFRSDRDGLINRLGGIERAAVSSGAPDAASYTSSFVNMRQGLLDLPEHPTVTASTDAASCSAAIKKLYDALVVGQPAAVIKAFNSYNR
jgi:hypothetical protein